MHLLYHNFHTTPCYFKLASKLSIVRIIQFDLVQSNYCTHNLLWTKFSLPLRHCTRLYMFGEDHIKKKLLYICIRFSFGGMSTQCPRNAHAIDRNRLNFSNTCNSLNTADYFEDIQFSKSTLLLVLQYSRYSPDAIE